MKAFAGYRGNPEHALHELEEGEVLMLKTDFDEPTLEVEIIDDAHVRIRGVNLTCSTIIIEPEVSNCVVVGIKPR